MAVERPSLNPSLVIAYVAMGAPPTVDGVTDEVKSQLSITRNEAIHPSSFSDKNLILAAENHNRRNETTRAMTRPGSRFGFKCSKTPGVYVRYKTTAMPAMLKPMEINKYFLEKYFLGVS